MEINKCPDYFCDYSEYMRYFDEIEREKERERRRWKLQMAYANSDDIGICDYANGYFYKD